MSERSDKGAGTSDEPTRLDGNAAAGILAEIFTMEMTSAESTCGACGQTSPMGALLMYGGQAGTVLRCPGCNAIHLRIVSVPEQGGYYYVDMRGTALLRIARSPS